MAHVAEVWLPLLLFILPLRVVNCVRLSPSRHCNRHLWQGGNVESSHVKPNNSSWNRRTHRALARSASGLGPEERASLDSMPTLDADGRVGCGEAEAPSIPI